jgi:hypothetical protein
MDHGRVVGKSTQERRGIMRRPRLRWLEDAEKIFGNVGERMTV